jgi:general secretion pathway protein K
MSRARDERGFVLLAVLLTLTLLAVVVTEMAFSARLEASMVRAYRDGVLARHLAEAAVQQALREIVTPAQVTALDESGQVVFYRVLPGQTTPTPLPLLPRTRVPLGAGEFSYRLADESARLGLNTTGADRLARLLDGLGVEAGQRDVVVDSLQDWRDADELHRLHGAESDFYLALPVPYRARNAPLQDAAELLQVRGVTPALYRGTAGHPGLGDLVTAAPVSAINLNTAPPAVLRALGLSDAEIADVVQARVRAPYPTVPGRFAGRGLTVGSAIFRIEAEGRAAGARSRVVAVVQRGRPTAPLEPTIVAWRPETAP